MQTERQRAREQLVTALLEGRTFQEVSRDSPVPLKRAMAYRLLHAVRTQGPIAGPRPAAGTSLETAWSGSSYAKLRRPNTAARAVRYEREYQPDQPRS